jgi:hypothetical protein
VVAAMNNSPKHQLLDSLELVICFLFQRIEDGRYLV